MMRQRPISISLIVAAARNGVIGKGGAMPWHLPGDLRYFKKVTMGKPVIMGQKTWESLKKRPLPGRANIVLTRKKDFSAQGAVIVHSLPEALQAAKAFAASDKAEEIFIIGGGAVFKQALPLADKIYVTEILAALDGDTFFKPSLPARLWRKNVAAAPLKHEKDSHAYRFVIYEKRGESRAAQKIGGWLSALRKKARGGLSLKNFFSLS